MILSKRRITKALTVWVRRLVCTFVVPKPSRPDDMHINDNIWSIEWMASMLARLYDRTLQLLMVHLPKMIYAVCGLQPFWKWMFWWPLFVPKCLKLTPSILANFACFLIVCRFFSKSSFFQKILSGIASRCQTVWIQIRPDIMSGLIWVQTVCKGYQQIYVVVNGWQRVYELCTAKNVKTLYKNLSCEKYTFCQDEL